jgi:hypothetical protein
VKYNRSVKKLISLTLLSLAPLAHSSEAKFHTWKGSYDLYVEILDSNFNPKSVALATSNGNSWTWFDESMKNVINVMPIGQNQYLKMTSKVSDIKKIYSDLMQNPSWKLDTGKTLFSWTEDSKKCHFQSFVLKHEKKLKKDGFKVLGSKNISEIEEWNQLYINGKNSLSLSIRKDKELCHRKILFTENKY